MTSEEAIQKFYEEGLRLIANPEEPRAFYLHNTRLIFKDHGLPENADIVTIVNFLKILIDKPHMEASLPPTETLNNAAKAMDEHLEKVRQSQQNAAQTQKEFEKRATQQKPQPAPVSKPPEQVVYEPPISTTPPVTVPKPTVIVPLADLAKESARTKIQAPPPDLEKNLRQYVEQIIHQQQASLPEEKVLAATENITQAVVQNLSSPTPQKTQALSTTVETTLQEAGVIFVEKEQLTDLIQQIQSSTPAQSVQKFFETLPTVQEVIAKPVAAQDLPTLQAKFEETVAMVFGDEPKLKGLPKETVAKVSQKATEAMTTQILSPKGWEQDPAIQAVKQALEKEGIGLTQTETKALVGKVEQTAQKLEIISALEKVDKPIPEEIFVKLGTEPQKLSPIKRFTASVEHIVSAPAAGAIINAKNKTPEWQDIAQGRFGERYLESAKVLVDAGMQKTHPTVVKLEEKGQRLLKVQQEKGKDKPAVTILKRYYNLTRQRGERIFDKDLGMYLPPRRFVSFVSGGRFSSFGSIQTTVYQKTFGRVAMAFSKSKIGQGISTFVAKKLGVQLASKGIIAAGVASGAVTGGIGTVITIAATVIPKAWSFIKEKLHLNTRLAGALVAGGMMLGGLFTLATGSLPILGAGLLVLGAGSLAVMAPGLGVGLGGLASGTAGGVASVISAITAGSFAGAPIAAGVAVGAGSIGFLAFVIIMIASGAFILPSGGGMQFPWTGYSTSCPAQFPTIQPLAGLSFQWPVEGDRSCTSPFGYRNDPFSPTECNCHTGIDIGRPENTLVSAVAEGTIYRTFYSTNPGDMGAYGNYIVIDHGGGLFSLYAHIKDFNPNGKIVVGAKVSKGAFLGRVDSTGRSTGPHLHLSFSDCGNVELGCFSSGEHTPSPCDYLPGCDQSQSCRLHDRASGCPAS